MNRVFDIGLRLIATIWLVIIVAQRAAKPQEVDAFGTRAPC
jgi:hypothetical protein